MSVSDPIADMLTCIRNANRIYRKEVLFPASKIKRGIADVLKREGFIEDVRHLEDSKQGMLKVYLKFGPDSEFVIHTIERVSKPGRRIYSGVEDIEPVLNGIGILVVSTPQGILSDRECRERRLGGEVLCRVW
jgi:small subunit ribosomal protein S8